MTHHTLELPAAAEAFARQLRREDRSSGTVENYLRHLRAFAAWLGSAQVSPETAAAWREHLRTGGYAPASVNAMLASLNKFFRFMGWEECRVRPLRIQRRAFCQADRELSREEYLRLVSAASAMNRRRLALLLETICATGIRVSEVRYITVEAVALGRAEVALKGKIRTILIPGKLRKKLLQYARQQKTASGEIFLTRNGCPLSRRQIWAEMKSLCAAAGVAAGKVFPHNLRHLFARTFYRVTRDVAKLADVLGHTSIDTTRIYLVSSGAEHARHLDCLGLIC